MTAARDPPPLTTTSCARARARLADIEAMSTEVDVRTDGCIALSWSRSRDVWRKGGRDLYELTESISLDKRNE